MKKKTKIRLIVAVAAAIGITGICTYSILNTKKAYDYTDYYVDMVFYNKFLKSYVLIDLKMNKLKAENLGQMNMYLNYYEQAINSEDDGKPIGIILCAEKDKVMLEYALGGLSNNIFA